MYSNTIYFVVYGLKYLIQPGFAFIFIGLFKKRDRNRIRKGPLVGTTTQVSGSADTFKLLWLQQHKYTNIYIMGDYYCGGGGNMHISKMWELVVSFS